LRRDAKSGEARGYTDAGFQEVATVGETFEWKHCCLLQDGSEENNTLDDTLRGNFEQDGAL
jgi:hypothetical protein